MQRNATPNNQTNSHWGEFEKDDKPDSVIPGEVVKYYIMQAMQQDPFANPPPCSSSINQPPTKPDPSVELSNETVGLEMDDRVIHTIKLMLHVKEMNQAIEAAKDSNDILSDTQNERLRDMPEHPVASMNHKINYPLQFMEKKFSDFAIGKAVILPEITADTAKKLMSKSVAALLAHAGFDTTTQNVLATMADATETYMRKMVQLLRSAVDRGENVGANGFPDAMERVFAQMKIGSVRDIHTYYHERVVNVRERLLEECRCLNLEYCSLAISSKPDVLGLDDIPKMDENDDVPEIHFPSMDDGVDELTPSLGAGLQMLHSLEQEVQLQNLEAQDDNASDRISIYN